MSPASPALLCWPIALLLLGRSLAFGWRGSFIGRDGPCRPSCRVLDRGGRRLCVGPAGGGDRLSPLARQCPAQMTTSPRTDTIAGAHQPGSGAGARNHHHVPQCYLKVKGFANSYGKDAQLYVVDMVRRRVFTTTRRPTWRPALSSRRPCLQRPMRMRLSVPLRRMPRRASLQQGPSMRVLATGLPEPARVLLRAASPAPAARAASA